MDEIREDIKKKQRQIEDLENAEESQEEIDKLKRELRSLETEHQKASEKYIQRFRTTGGERYSVDRRYRSCRF